MTTLSPTSNLNLFDNALFFFFNFTTNGNIDFDKKYNKINLKMKMLGMVISKLSKHLKSWKETVFNSQFILY